MNVSFDDFAKLDIRIGTILSVETIPDTDKLLKLTVDFSEESSRQVISGIKHLLEDCSVLEGKQAAFLTNLEPRTIRGFESQAMILAVGNDDEFSMLSPQEKVTPGTPVR